MIASIRLLFLFIEEQPAKDHGEMTSNKVVSHKINKVPLLLQNLVWTYKTHSLWPLNNSYIPGTPKKLNQLNHPWKIIFHLHRRNWAINDKFRGAQKYSAPYDLNLILQQVFLWITTPQKSPIFQLFAPLLLLIFPILLLIGGPRAPLAPFFFAPMLWGYIIGATKKGANKKQNGFWPPPILSLNCAYG